MQLVVVIVLEALGAGADREQPVRAHLHIVIGLLQLLVVEGDAAGAGFAAQISVSCALVKRRAAEVRHRVGLAPDHVVEHPEIEILQRRADAEDVVVRADHPDRAIGLQDAARRLQPGPGERVVVGKALELVPVVVDGIDLALVGPGEALLELQVVGRIGEDEIHRV
jgi:hypothetical protein